MALLTLGLSPYEVRILTILQAHLKSPLHATGRPNELARKKELAIKRGTGATYDRSGSRDLGEQVTTWWTAARHLLKTFSRFSRLKKT